MKKINSEEMKSVLMEKFNLKDKQYEYELKRSNKKNRPISDWLSEKYGQFVSVEEKTLFHFTKKMNLASIMQNGIIFGDVIGTNLITDSRNAPNLTSQGFFHDPSSYLEKGIDNDHFSYLRLVVKVKSGDEKLLNYRWFDKNIGNGHIGRICDTDKSNFGELSKQYLYKGVVDPSMIVRVDEYDTVQQKFITLSSEQVEKICVTYDGLFSTTPDHLRICGGKVNDMSGGAKDYFSKTDHLNPYNELYKLSDYIVTTLKGKKLDFFCEKIHYFAWMKNGGFDINSMCGFVLHFYNQLVEHDKRVDEEEFANSLRTKIEEHFAKWIDQTGSLINGNAPKKVA